MTYEIDVTPANDPLGTILTTLGDDDLIAGTRFRPVKLGTGLVKVVIDADNPKAAALEDEVYLRIRDTVIGGYIYSGSLNSAQVKLISEKEDHRRLSWSGLGSLGPIARMSLGDDIYALGPPVQVARGSYDVPGMWTWTNVYYGGIARRMFEEGRDHPDDPFAGMTVTFDRDGQTGGAPWTLAPTLHQERVGTNVLDAYINLIKAGVIFELTPGLVLNAWETFGSDHSGAAYAADVVRFMVGANALDTAANLLTEVERAWSSSRVSQLLVIGADNVVVKVTDPTAPFGKVGVYHYEASSDPVVLAAVGNAELARRLLRTIGALKLPVDLADDPTNGKYLPGPGRPLWVGNTVSAFTGSAAYDFDAEFPVAALDFVLTDSEGWTCQAELGTPFIDRAQAAQDFAIRQIIKSSTPGPHQHPELLCQVGTEGTSSITRLYFSDVPTELTTKPAVDSGWDNGTSSPDYHRMTATPSATVNGGVSPTTRDDTLAYSFSMEIDAALAAILAAGGATVAMQARARTRSGIGINESAQDLIGQIGIRVTTGDSTTIRGTALALHSLASSAGTEKFNQSGTYRNYAWPPTGQTNVLSAVAGATAGDFLLVEVGYRNFTSNPPDATGGHIWMRDSAASDLPEDSVETSNLNSWIEFAVEGAGATAGDLPQDTVAQGEESVGTSTRASRCDHEHAHGRLSPNGNNYHSLSHINQYIFHGEAAPAVTDDEGDGYVTGTHWIDDSTGDVYILTDPTAGAAVWEQISGSGGSVATDAIWDTAGDLAYGTGSDAASRLALGTAGQVLKVNAGATAPEWGAASGGAGGTGSYAETIGDASATSFQITHDLGSTDVIVQLYDLTGSDPVEATADASSITVDDADNVTLVFGSAPAADAYRVVVLGVGAGGITLLASVDVGVNTATVNLSIPTTYRDLIIRASIRSTRAATLDRFRMQVGTGGVVDTGANYQYLATDTSSSDSTTVGTLLSIGRFSTPGATQTAGLYGLAQINIADYAGSQWKAVSSRADFYASADSRRGESTGHWRNTNPIDILRFTVETGSIAAGSTISVYGVR